ncbi:MAG: glutaredoxin family protein [Phycisphaerales bacterium]|nr:glutaredoxin family protein [Phycisphaerales bacterium]
MNKVTFFTKDCCPLCESAWFVVERLRGRLPFDVEKIDITDPGNRRWYAMYCNDIPVIHLNGREVFRHRVSERRLRELIESAEGGA